MRTRKGLLFVWIALLCSTVAALFWYNEYIYSLPTPPPRDYRAVEPGTVIDAVHQLRPDATKPVALHFFNPDCPCSRFNRTHFRSLVKKYGNDIQFVAVPIILVGQEYTDEEVRESLGVAIPVWRKSGLAEACGVYSTPQSVVVDPDGKLYYRGNYNRARYCADPKTNYAEIAIQSLLTKSRLPEFDVMALRAYGCTIDGCVK